MCLWMSTFGVGSVTGSNMSVARTGRGPQSGKSKGIRILRGHLCLTPYSQAARHTDIEGVSSRR